MTEQTHLEPVDQPKPRLQTQYPAQSLPAATRPSPSIDPANFERFGDELKLAGGTGEQVLAEVSRALGNAQDAMNTIANAEDAIINAENEIRRAGQSSVGLTYDKGVIRAIPGRYNELAETVSPALEKAIKTLDGRMKAHATTQLRMLDQMDAALQCKDTARDPHLQADIRAHMKALGSHKAKGFAATAAMNGDTPALHVILSSPAYLLGIDQETVSTVRETARKTVTPALHRAYEIGNKGRDLMEIAMKGLTKKRDTIEGYRLQNQKDASAALARVRHMTKND